jgi:hypothetical protein
MTYQFYNFQPKSFNLTNATDPMAEGFSSDNATWYWNNFIKTPFLQYMNRDASFDLPAEFYSWISANVTNSVENFKLELYDKFAIINIEPAYASESLILLLAAYIQSVLPDDANDQPYTFTSFVEELYEYILNLIKDDD